MPPWPCIATPPQPPPHQLLKINQIHVPLLRRRRSREAATCSRRRRTRPVSSGQNRKRDLIASATDRSPRRPFSTPARRRAAFRPPHASFAWRLEQLARVGRRALPVPEVEVWGREVLLLPLPPAWCEIHPARRRRSSWLLDVATQILMRLRRVVY